MNLLTRPDGRKLSYDDAGPQDGYPVFYFHGIPSAAADWRIWGNEALLNAVGVRIIAVDRPGVGGSTFQPARRLRDWPMEVEALADHLELDRFSILSYSGGGPYAAICAAHIPERLHAVGLVSSPTSFDHKELLAGITPGNLQYLRLAAEKPWLNRFMYRQMGLIARMASRKYLERVQSVLEGADREAFIRPEVHQAMLAAIGSPRGEQWDTRLMVLPWDFSLEDITIPVYLWHGGQDHNASPAMGRFLEKAIPTSKMTFLPDEGHISLIVNYAGEILRTLIADPEEIGITGSEKALK